MKSISLILTISIFLGIIPQVLNSQSFTPTIENGLSQDILEFSVAKEWIKEEVWVEAPFDSDFDGNLDRLHVYITRPLQTNTELIKLPIIYQSSPYYGLSLWRLFSLRSSDKFMWDVKHELGEVPKANNKSVSKTRTKRPIMAFIEDRNWVPKGFITVYSSSPGTGLSDGAPTGGGTNEAQAPKAVIDWLCGRTKAYSSRNGTQEVKAFWSTGKVAMMGTSYDGTLALAAATTGVEGLEAIVPIAAVSSFYNYYRSNGLVRSPEGYLGEDVNSLYNLIHTGRKSTRKSNNTKIRDDIILKGIDRKTGDYNEFWDERNYIKKLDSIKAAVFISHGFNDWNVMPEQSYMLYKALKEKNIPVQLYYHQDGHGGTTPQHMLNRWFTKYLFDIDSGESDAKVTIVSNISGASPSKHIYETFPNPASEEVCLYLVKGNSFTGTLNLNQSEESAIETFVDDRELTGKTLATVTSNNRLLYLTSKLTEDVHLSGLASVSIEMSCNKPAANLSVWLISLPWNEEKNVSISENIVTRSWADPQNHNSEKNIPLALGEYVNVTFDLNPDDQIIKKGQQIGLLIFSSDPEFTILPKPGTEISVKLDKTTLCLPIVNGKQALENAFK